MSRRIELWVSIQELNEQGEYSSVELHSGKDISTGGVFQLRQVREKCKDVSFELNWHVWEDCCIGSNPLMFAYGVLSKQGHSRRLQVCVKPVQNSGTLPLLVEAVLSVSIGCVSARSAKLQRPLDSYQVCGTHMLHIYSYSLYTCYLDCFVNKNKKKLVQ